MFLRFLGSSTKDSHRGNPLLKNPSYIKYKSASNQNRG